MKRAIKAEERKLWLAAMRDVRRKKVLVSEAESPLLHLPVEESVSPNQQDLEKQAKGSKPKIETSSDTLPRALNSETTRRLKTKAARPQAKLDLHGMTEAVAHAALIAFIGQARIKKYHLILVITGKGKSGTGILRRNLPLWLEAPDLRQNVLAIAPAFTTDGGDGAFYVHLKR